MKERVFKQQLVNGEHRQEISQIMLIPPVTCNEGDQQRETMGMMNPN